MTPVYMTVRDAAHITGIPVRTIQRWVVKGWLTDHGDGMTYLVDIGQVVDLAEQRPNRRLRYPGVVA